MRCEQESWQPPAPQLRLHARRAVGYPSSGCSGVPRTRRSRHSARPSCPGIYLGSLPRLCSSLPSAFPIILRGLCVSYFVFGGDSWLPGYRSVAVRSIMCLLCRSDSSISNRSHGQMWIAVCCVLLDASLATNLKAHSWCCASSSGRGVGVRLPSGPAFGHIVVGAS